MCANKTVPFETRYKNTKYMNTKNGEHVRPALKAKIVCANICGLQCPNHVKSTYPNLEECLGSFINLKSTFTFSFSCPMNVNRQSANLGYFCGYRGEKNFPLV